MYILPHALLVPLGQYAHIHPHPMPQQDGLVHKSGAGKAQLGPAPSRGVDRTWYNGGRPTAALEALH